MKAIVAVLFSLFALSAVAEDLKKQTSSVIEILSQVNERKHPLASRELSELLAHMKNIPASEGEAIRRKGGPKKSEHSEERQYGPSAGCVIAFVALGAVSAVAAGAYLLAK